MNALGYAEVAIVVKDVKRAAAFYTDVVGYEVSKYDTGPRSTIIKVGPDSYLGLWEPGVWKSDYFGGRYGYHFGRGVLQTHIVFAVAAEEVPALKERLNRSGYETVGPNVHADGTPHLYVSDPDGHAVEFWGKFP